MVKKKTKKNEESKIFAFIATFFSILGFIIAIIFKKNDKYVMFYAKQSLIVFILALITSVIDKALLSLPVIGDLVSVILQLIIIIFWVLSWIYALSGEMKELPYIGSYSKYFKF